MKSAGSSPDTFAPGSIPSSRSSASVGAFPSPSWPASASSSISNAASRDRPWLATPVARSVATHQPPSRSSRICVAPIIKTLCYGDRYLVPMLLGVVSSVSHTRGADCLAVQISGGRPCGSVSRRRDGMSRCIDISHVGSPRTSTKHPTEWMRPRICLLEFGPNGKVYDC